MRARPLVSAVVAGSALAALAWSALAPVRSASRDQIFEIPAGTWARRMSGDKVEILPDHMRLTLGVRDILVLRNHDAVPQIFGPTLMMPGQTFRLPFEQAAVYTFSCTAHASGQMTISVQPYPATPWAKIGWRTHELWWQVRLLMAHICYRYHL
jgi:hypothetical protein